MEDKVYGILFLTCIISGFFTGLIAGYLVSRSLYKKIKKVMRVISMSIAVIFAANFIVIAPRLAKDLVHLSMDSSPYTGAAAITFTICFIMFLIGAAAILTLVPIHWNSQENK